MFDDTRSPRALLARYLFLVLLPVALGWDSFASQPKVDDLAPLKSQLGQFFIFGLHTPELSEKTKTHIRETGASAFILFRRNLLNNKQVTRLTDELHSLSQEMTGQPALIGLDQEGGKVIRIPFSPPLPSAFAMGQSRDPAIVEELSFQVGRALRQLGFNMNFAPVLDLGLETSYSFLGQRAFSSDPIWASDLGAAFARGQAKAKILPVAKHFPGIGPVPNDPHLSLVRRSVSPEELRTRDLVPFENFARLPVSGMMISHLIYPKIDPSDSPGTFSKVIIQDLLQKQLGYSGLVVTDDLMMAGAQASQNFQENVVKAYLAGADLMMISWSEKRQKQAVAALWSALQSGRISASSIQQRLDKISKIRQSVRMDQKPVALDPNQLLVYNFKAYENVVEKMFRQSLSVADRWPASINTRSMLILKSQSGFIKSLSMQPKIKALLPEEIQQILNETKDGAENAIYQDARWLLFVRNRQEANFAASIAQNVRHKIFLINLWRPDVKIGSFTHELGLFMSHPDSDQILSTWIIERLLRSPTQPSDERLRFGPYPSPDLPKSRSTSGTRVALKDLGRFSHSHPKQ